MHALHPKERRLPLTAMFERKRKTRQRGRGQRGYACASRCLCPVHAIRSSASARGLGYGLRVRAYATPCGLRLISLRLINLPSSRSHSTELAASAHSIQSSMLRPTVENAFCRKGT